MFSYQPGHSIFGMLWTKQTLNIVIILPHRQVSYCKWNVFNTYNDDIRYTFFIIIYYYIFKYNSDRSFPFWTHLVFVSVCFPSVLWQSSGSYICYICFCFLVEAIVRQIRIVWWIFIVSIVNFTVAMSLSMILILENDPFFNWTRIVIVGEVIVLRIVMWIVYLGQGAQGGKLFDNCPFLLGGGTPQ